MSNPDIKHEVALVRESLGNRKKGQMAMDIIEQKWDELERENDKLTEQLESKQVVSELDIGTPILSPRAQELTKQAKFIDFLDGYDPNNKNHVKIAGERLHLQNHGSFDAFNAWVAWAAKGVNFAGYNELGVQWVRFSQVSVAVQGVTKELPEDETPPNG